MTFISFSICYTIQGMRKILTAVLFIELSAFYVCSQIFAMPLAANSPSGTGANEQIPSSSATEPIAGRYKDGVYTGLLVDAFFGPVQVYTTISNGRILDVTFLAYPSDQGHTLDLSKKLMPVLAREAIQIQSADVDIVSGATQTVQGFHESLGSALAQATL
jgi:uncharacterized protein with FMN-binding domain